MKEERERGGTQEGEKGISSKESTERVVLTALFPRPPLPARIRQPCLSLCPPLLSVFPPPLPIPPPPSFANSRSLGLLYHPLICMSCFASRPSSPFSLSTLSPPPFSRDRESRIPFKRRVARPSDTFHRNCSTRRKVNNPLTTEGNDASSR